jgi:hypothetical protein
MQSYMIEIAAFACVSCAWEEAPRAAETPPTHMSEIGDSGGSLKN